MSAFPFVTKLTQYLQSGLGICLLSFVMLTQAETNNKTHGEPLPVEAVFIPKIETVATDAIELSITVPKGYYLYKSRFQLSSNDLTLGKITYLTASRLTQDRYFGEQAIWEQDLRVRVAYQVQKSQNPAISDLLVRFQGCEKDGICYPPTDKALSIKLPTTTTSNVASTTTSNITSSSGLITSNRDSSRLSKLDKLGLSGGKPKLLPEDQAFAFYTSQQDASAVVIHWQVAKDYYLYQDKIVLIGADDNANQQLGNVLHSEGYWHEDAFFGRQLIYTAEQSQQDVAKTVVYLKQPLNGAADMNFFLSYQGCADSLKVCYPPVTKKVTLGEMPRIEGLSATEQQQFEKALSNRANSLKAATNFPSTDSWQSQLTEQVWLGLLALLLAGSALAFTPCVLPMLPILLGMLKHQFSLTAELKGAARRKHQAKIAVLAFYYAVGMASMLAVFGLLVSATGINLQILSQSPWILATVASLFVLLGLAMLGVFQLRLPSGLQNKVFQWQARFNQPKKWHLVVVGALSALVVGPCVAPPLIAVLAFISTTGNRFLGGVYLFALGMGMGLPLILFSALFGSIPASVQNLAKTGMAKIINQLFAVLLFALALWLLNRLLPERLLMVLWGGLGYLLAFYLLRALRSLRHLSLQKRLWRLSVGAILMISFSAASIWLGAGVLGRGNLFNPLAQQSALHFRYVNTRQELTTVLQQADKPVLLDFYADWCYSCQEIEKITFLDPQVQDVLLNEFILLKLDISTLTPEKKALMKELQLIGPPVLLFFSGGQELRDQRLVGSVKAKTLLTTLGNIANQSLKPHGY